MSCHRQKNPVLARLFFFKEFSLSNMRRFPRPPHTVYLPWLNLTVSPGYTQF